MRSKHADKGKETEQAVREWLEARSLAEFGFAFHRLPDARSARGALAPQPADFYISRKVFMREVFSGYMEAKETAELARLPKAKIRQFGLLHKFWLAGQKVIVVVRRTAHNDWTYLRGRDLFIHDDFPKSFPFAGRPTFPTHEALLNEVFK